MGGPVTWSGLSGQSLVTATSSSPKWRPLPPASLAADCSPQDTPTPQWQTAQMEPPENQPGLVFTPP